MRLDRRKFCSLAVILPLARHSLWTQQTTRPNVATIDRERILAAANRALERTAVPLTALAKPPSPTTEHDYFTLAAPDAASDARRDALLRLTIDLPALGG